MPVAQSIVYSRPPLRGLPGEIIVKLAFSDTYAGYVLGLNPPTVPGLDAAEFNRLLVQRLGGASNGMDFAVQNTLTVTGATNAEPVVVTTAEIHRLSDGDQVVIASVGGTTAANGTRYVKVLTATTFELYTDAALQTPVEGNANYTSGGTVAFGFDINHIGVVRLYTRGTSTQASSTVVADVYLKIDWVPRNPN